MKKLSLFLTSFCLLCSFMPITDVFATNARDLNFDSLSPQQIVDRMGPYFQADYENTGILASVSMAQFIIESGWGKSDLTKNANNLFGMKFRLSNVDWTGCKYTIITKEYISGQYVNITADFRAYNSIEDSIRDHSNYLINSEISPGSKRYTGLQGCKDYRKAAFILKNGGYATDPEYANKICSKIEQYGLTKFDLANLQIPWVDVPFAVSSNIDQDLYSWPRNNTEITGKRIAQRSIINILEVKPGQGSTYGWGRTKDGWINLDYTSYDPLTVTIDTDVRAGKFIYTGAGTNTSSTGIRIGRGTFRIAEVKQSPGSICGWGKLGDGRGWINLDFTSYDPYNAASSSISWVNVPFTVSSNIEQDLYNWPRNNTEITGKRIAQRSIINILEVKPGPGSTYGWGRTKDGWINLDYTSYDPLTVTIDTDVRAGKFIYTGAGTNTSSTGIRIGRGIFRIAEVRQGPGSICGWGKLGDGRGWINLDFTSYTA